MRIIYISVFVVIIDQITKLLVKGISIPFLNVNIEGMKYGQSTDVFGSFFCLTYVENPGMAFGIDLGESSKLFLSLFSIIASIAIIYYLFKMKDERFILRASLALILGGAIGNLIDRVFYGVIYGYSKLFYGSVVDFFNVDFFDFTIFSRTYERWPIFNVADAAVTMGVVLLLIFHRSIEGRKDIETVNGTGADTVAVVNGENCDYSGNNTIDQIDLELNEKNEYITAENGKDNKRKETEV
ncbi:MAG: signal peptidase II [Ignavibacteria bacterium RBG_13_36_8]|nr:MAG: signal peptidase II [Ignavibacteria bacterium RBG_13_36_8]